MNEDVGRGAEPPAGELPLNVSPDDVAGEVAVNAGEAPIAPPPVATASPQVGAPAKRHVVGVWPRLAVALATLVAVGASLVLTAQQAAMPHGLFTRYLGSNGLPMDQRTEVLQSLLIGAAVPIPLVLLWVLRRKQAGVRGVLRAAAIVSPLLLAWTVPSLLAYEVWYDDPLPYLIFMSAVLLGAERLFRMSFAALPRRHSNKPWLSERTASILALSVVVLAAAGYAFFTARLSILHHKRLASTAYDLGIFDNLMYNNWRGKIFRAPVLAPDLSYLSNHAEFGSIIFSPIYALRQDATTLLAMQSVFLGAAAIPLYFFAKTQLPRLSAVLIALGYLLYAPLHGPNFYDFHWMPMAVPFWFGLFYAIATRKRWLVTLFVILLLPLREETGVMLAVLGAVLALSGFWFRLGVVFAIVGTTWFTLMKFVIMPLAGTWWFSNMYQDLIAPGEEGYRSVVRTLLVNPNYVWKTLATQTKLIYVLHLMAPLLFLPLRRPLLTLLAAPGFFFTLLTTNYQPTISIRFQYTTHWIPWVFGTSIVALKLLELNTGKVRRQAAFATVIVGIFVHSFVFGSILQHNTFVGGFQKLAYAMSPEEVARYNKLLQLVARIPKTASVGATETEAPHVSNRLDAYALRISNGPPKGPPAEYMLVRHGMLGSDERRNFVEALTKASYGLLDSGNELYLFKQGHHSSETKSALRRLGVSLPSSAATRSD